MTELSEAVLDIHALAVLTVYEATAYEPRFRHVKLREISTTVQFEQAVIHEGPPDDPVLRPWFTSKLRRHGYLWKPSTEACGDEPDTPGNMIAKVSEKTGHRSIIGLTEEQKETIFYQARMHNGCVDVSGIFDQLLQLFPSSQKLIVKSASGFELESVVSDRMFTFISYFGHRDIHLSVTRPSVFFPRDFSGKEDVWMQGQLDPSPHCIFAFRNTQGDGTYAFLDISSMQYGELGRGPGGEPFWCGHPADYAAKVNSRVASRWEVTGTSDRALPDTDEDKKRQKAVAMKVKERYGAGPSGFCGYCGGPQPPKRCLCQGEYYCNASHQKKGWAYHRNWCGARKKA